jgi:hypothetical protein
MGTRGAVWAVAAMTGALGLAACGSSPSPSSSPTTSSTAIAPASALATGTYVPAGASGTPHYFVTVGSANTTAFTGAMNFEYQDGRTAQLFDFSGTVTGLSATARSSNVAHSSSTPKTVSSVPATLRMGVGAGTLTFVGCRAYLPLTQSAGACTFSGPAPSAQPTTPPSTAP